jgi:TRAP-type mannitol/chloroaromatic compound transport system substrate-binding protein
MDRRKFLRTVAATGTAAAGASTLSAPAIAQGVKQFKMVTTWPKNSPGLFSSAHRLAERIAVATDRKIQVRVFAAGELVPAFESFDAVSQGKAEMYHGVEYYWQGKSKAFSFFSGVPYGLTALEHLAWIYFGGGQEVWDEVSAQFNVKGFVLASTGVQMGGWFNKEINRVDDLRGLKFRMPGIGGEVLRKLGVAVVNLPGGEVYPALASGAIDGTEWVGPWLDMNMAFYKVAKYYYWPGFHEPGSVFSCGINKKLWDGLTKDQRSAIETATQAEANFQMCEYQARNSNSLEVLVAKHGVQLRRYSDELLMEFAKTTREVLAELGNTDAATKKAYTSFLNFHKESVSWARIGDLAFLRARDTAFGKG